MVATTSTRWDRPGRDVDVEGIAEGGRRVGGEKGEGDQGGTGGLEDATELAAVDIELQLVPPA